MRTRGTIQYARLDRVPFQGGWTLSHLFLAYIPRAIWPGKPQLAIGIWITEHFGSGPGVPSHTGPSWIGELYRNFGYWGIIVGMLVIGVLFRLVHELFFRRSSTIPAILVRGIFLFTTLPALGGSLQGPSTGTTFALIPLLAAHLLVWTLTRSPSPRLEPGGSEPRTADARIGV